MQVQNSGGHFVLAPRTVVAPGLTSQGAFSSTGAGNQVSKAGYVRIKSLRIGTAEMQDEAAKVLPLSDQSNNRGSRAARAGILGLEVFERFRVSIDRTRHLVAFEAPGAMAPPRPWLALPITFDEDAPLTSRFDLRFAGPVCAVARSSLKSADSQPDRCRGPTSWHSFSSRRARQSRSHSATALPSRCECLPFGCVMCFRMTALPNDNSMHWLPFPPPQLP